MVESKTEGARAIFFLLLLFCKLDNWEVMKTVKIPCDENSRMGTVFTPVYMSAMWPPHHTTLAQLFHWVLVWALMPLPCRTQNDRGAVSVAPSCGAHVPRFSIILSS